MKLKIHGLPDLKLAAVRWSCSDLYVELYWQEKTACFGSQNNPLCLMLGPRIGPDTAFCLEEVSTSCLNLGGPVSHLETIPHLAHQSILQACLSNVNKKIEIEEIIQSYEWLRPGRRDLLPQRSGTEICLVLLCAPSDLCGEIDNPHVLRAPRVTG